MSVGKEGHTTSVDEERQRLRRKLEEVLGREEARTLMDDVRAGTHHHELHRRDMQLLEARMEAQLASLEARLLDRMNEQTKTLFRTFIVSNSAMEAAVAGLAFGAARLG